MKLRSASLLTLPLVLLAMSGGCRHYDEARFRQVTGISLKGVPKISLCRDVAGVNPDNQCRPDREGWVEVTKKSGNEPLEVPTALVDALADGTDPIEAKNNFKMKIFDKYIGSGYRGRVHIRCPDYLLFKETKKNSPDALENYKRRFIDGEVVLQSFHENFSELIVKNAHVALKGHVKNVDDEAYASFKTELKKAVENKMKSQARVGYAIVTFPGGISVVHEEMDSLPQNRADFYNCLKKKNADSVVVGVAGFYISNLEIVQAVISESTIKTAIEAMGNVTAKKQLLAASADVSGAWYKNVVRTFKLDAQLLSTGTKFVPLYVWVEEMPTSTASPPDAK